MVTGSSGRRLRLARALLAAGLGPCIGCAALAFLPLPSLADGWRVVPSIGLSGTLTDNVALDPSGRQRGDFVTQVSPGIRVDGSGGRTRLNLDYSLNALLYARDSRRNNNQNSLRADGFLEAIDNRLFVDASASITQQARSAFGPQGTDGSNVDPNRAETSSYRLSPYWKSRFGSLADYQVRYAWTATRADAQSLGGTQTHAWNASAEGITGLAPLTWSVFATYTQDDYDRGRDTESGRLQGSLVYRIDPQFRVSAAFGREANDYLSVRRETKTTYGGGFDWSPTERTQVSAFLDERFFGRGHRFSFKHRTPRTAWSISDVKDTQTLANQLAVGQATAFDLLFNALASRFPDPVLRAQATEVFLRATGIPRDLNLPLAALTDRVFIERRREASVALLGARNTVTVTVHRSDRRSLTESAGVFDDFNLSSDVRQKGASASWAHDLTSTSALNLLGSWIKSTGTSDNLETSQWSLRLLLTTQLGAKTSGTLGLRHVRFDDSGNNANSYRENAVTATVTHRF